ncbi:MAG: recombination-associated protein RdgC [Candidatus Brocadiia bacterium]
MGIIAGSTTFTRYYASKTKIDPFGEGFEQNIRRNASHNIETLSTDKAVGWVAPTHLLDANLSLEKTVFGDWLCIVMRADHRSVPSNLLKAYVEIEIDGLLRNGKGKIARKEKLEIAEKVHDEMIKKVLPRIAGTDVAWNLKTGDVFVGTQSAAALDSFAVLFKDTFGVEVYPADIREMVGRFGSEELSFKFSDLLPSNFTQKEAPSQNPDGSVLPLADEFIGREFLTWLWYASETRSGDFKLLDKTSVSILVEDFLVFATGEKEGQKSILRNGTPTSSAEAYISMKSGRMLEKAKITLADSEQEWHFTLSSNSLSISGLKLPKGEERHPAGRARERCDALRRLEKYIDGLFLSFLKLRTGEKEWEIERRRLMDWITKKGPGHAG